MKLLNDCLKSLRKVKGEVSFEIIVPDNGSSDDSVGMMKRDFPAVKLIENKINLGFAAGNNKAKKYARGGYVLFLNSDTIVYKNTLRKTVEYLDEYPKVGALTCKIILPDGSLDRDSRRSFITPWIGLVHLFLKLDRIFPKSKLFGQYWYGYVPEDKEHEVDALQGAFFLVRRKVLDEVGWFDEDYFLDGEDIDLSWRIKKAGWRIMYYPKVKITHFKGASKGKVESNRKQDVSLSERLQFRMAGVDSMELFVRKRLRAEYPLVLVLTVLLGIKVLKLLRFTRTVLFG